MAVTIILAEKPSQARAYVEALTGRPATGRGPFSTPAGTVVTAQGHLRRYEEPRDRGLVDWHDLRWPDLCTSPPLVPRDAEAKRALSEIRKLLAGAGRVIIATDPDREGDGIAWNILQMLSRLPPAVDRMLCAESNPDAIRRAFERIEPASRTRPRAIAAGARARIDQMAGINLTVAVCTALRPRECRDLWPVGRVKTPTLWLVAQRERAIAEFRPVDHFLITVTVAVTATVAGVSRPATAVLVHRPDPHLVDRSEATSLALPAADATGVLAVDRSDESVPAPLPYDKPSLLQAAASRLGWRPDVTTGVLQALYEAGHVTYPRSGCRKLSSADADQLPVVCAAISASSSELAASSRAVAATPVIRRPRVIDDAAVAKASHTAIVPTVTPLRSTVGDWHLLYGLIAAQYLRAFAPDGRDEVTSVTLPLQLNGTERVFSASGRRRILDGWRSIGESGSPDGHADGAGDGDQETSPAVESLPAGIEGGPARCIGSQLVARRTQPPRRYSWASLMADMSGAHRWVSDKLLAETLRTKDHPGLGTPATIETIPLELAKAGLIQEMASARSAKLPPLRAPDHTMRLMESLEQAVPEFVRPDLTARLELALAQIADMPSSQAAQAAADELVERYAAAVKRWFAAIKTLPALTVEQQSQPPKPTAIKSKRPRKAKHRAHANPPRSPRS